MTQGTKCPHCGKLAMVRKQHDHVEQVGAFTVTDSTATQLVCTACGEWSMSLADLAGYERRAARLALSERPDANGAALKYARKALGLRQQDLAALLKSTAETLSRYENDREPTPRPVQLAIAGLLGAVESNGVNIDDMVEHARNLPPVPPVLHVPPLRRAI